MGIRILNREKVGNKIVRSYEDDDKFFVAVTSHAEGTRHMQLDFSEKVLTEGIAKALFRAKLKELQKVHKMNIF